MRQDLKIKDQLVTGEDFIVSKHVDGVLITNPVLSEKDLFKYYDSSKYISHNKGRGLFNRLFEFFSKWMLRKKFNMIKPYIKQNSLVADFGCGTGHLYSFLKKKINFKGEYVGYDISSEMINFAKKKHKKARFENINILNKRINENFDYVLINGTFNNKTKNNFLWVKKCLKILFKKTKKAIAFNNLTTYVDYFDKKLYYIRPEKIFSFCKTELSPLVILNHNYHIKKQYLPYEFTTYVYKTKIKIRKSLM